MTSKDTAIGCFGNAANGPAPQRIYRVLANISQPRTPQGSFDLLAQARSCDELGPLLEFPSDQFPGDVKFSMNK